MAASPEPTLSPAVVSAWRNAATTPLAPLNTYKAPSTASPVGGALGAVLRGTATVAPIAGAVASFIPTGAGNLLGGGLSAIGEAAREDANGEPVNFARIGGAAALGAAPGILKVAGRGLKAANAVNLTAKGLEAANAATKTATASGDLASALGAVSQPALKTSTAGKLNGAAAKALAGQYGAVPAPVARSTDLTGTVGKLAQMGITKPQDAERVASGITGSNGLLTKAVATAAGGAVKVNTDGLEGVVKDAIANAGLVGNDAKSVTTIANGQLTKLRGGPNASITGAANPTDALSTMRGLESRIADLSGKGGNYKLTDPVRQDKAGVLQSLHDEIQDRLYNAAGADKNVSKVLTPGIRNSLVNLHPTSKAWSNFVDNTIMKAKSVSDLRGAQAPFVRIGKVINAADTNSATVGGKVANALAGGHGGLIKSAVEGVVNSNVAKRGQAGVLQGLANLTSGENSGIANAGADIAKGVGKAVAGTGKVAARGALAAATADNLAGKIGQPSTANGKPQPSQTPIIPPADQSQSTNSGSVFSPQVLQAMAINDIERTGGKNLSAISTLDNLFGPKSQPTKQLSATQQSQVNDLQSAMSLMDTAEQELNNLGGAQGPAAEIANIPVAGKFLQPKVAAYNQTRLDLASALAKALTGGIRSTAIVKGFEQSLPNPTDSPQQAAQKLANIRLELANKAAVYGLDASGNPTQPQ